MEKKPHSGDQIADTSTPWDHLVDEETESSEELSPAEALRLSVRQGMEACQQEHLDDPDYTKSPQYFDDALASIENMPEPDLEALGMSEEEALRTVYEEIISFSKDFGEQGGTFPSTIDELIYMSDETIQQTPGIAKIFEAHSADIEFIRGKRIEQMPQQTLGELQQLSDQLQELRSKHDELGEDGFYLYSVNYGHKRRDTSSRTARILERVKQHEAEIIEQGGSLEEVYAFIGEKIMPEYLPHTSDRNDRYDFSRIMRLTKIHNGLLEYVDDETRSLVEFATDPGIDLSEGAQEKLEDIIGDYLTEDDRHPLLEDGKPNDYFRQVMFFSHDIQFHCLLPEDDNDSSTPCADARELMQAYFEPETLQVIDEICEQLDKKQRAHISGEALALLCLEKDPTLRKAKIDLAGRTIDYMLEQRGQEHYKGLVLYDEDINRILIGANTVEEAQKNPDDILRDNNNTPADRCIARADLRIRRAGDKMSVLKILTAINDEIPDGEIPEDRLDFVTKQFAAAFSTEEAIDEAQVQRAIEHFSDLKRLYSFEKGDKHADILVEKILSKNLITSENFDDVVDTAIKNYYRINERMSKIPNEETRKRVIDRVFDLDIVALAEVNDEEIDDIIDMVERVESSNSLDLRRISKELVDQLINSCTTKNDENGEYSLDTATAHERLEQIEDVFLRNNLPLAAKYFLIFAKLHPKDKFEKDFVRPRLSPTLLEADNNGPFGRYGLMLRDIVKNSIESNDLDFRKYLENMRDSQKIIDRIRSGEVNFDQLSEDEQRETRAFISHVATIYNPTRRGQENPIDPAMPITNENIQKIYDLLHLKPDGSIADFTVRYFGRTNGLRTIEGALQMMDKKRDEADQRNRETARSELIIHSGDLIKNVNGKYLDGILGIGSNCKEFLGRNADSDGTPLDTDLTMVLGGDSTIDQCSEIQTNPNGDYGYVWFIVENTPDRFITTRKGEGHPGGDVEEPNAASDRLELFQTGVTGDSHYGIRTGFGSEHIKAIVIQEPEEFRDRTFFRIVKNGFYIPVYERKTGKLIFTPEQYDQMREQLSGNPEYRMGEYRHATAEDLAHDAERIAALGLGQELDVEENKKDTIRKDQAIRDAIMKKLEGTGLTMRGEIDGDLTPGVIEVSSTGSTGRGTNVPHDGDFDYIFRIDRKIFSDTEKLKELADKIKSAIIMTPGVSTERSGGVSPHDIRTEHVHVDGLEDEVDIDITFVQRTDKITYPTERAVADYLSNLSGAEREQAVKNIIAAKKLFKKFECYKPKHAGGTDEKTGKAKAQGGMGGIGTENWILQHGGSLTAAARSFLEAAGALDGGEPIPFEQFIKTYQVWDLGANHTSEEKNKYPHDNFIANNMDEQGYKLTIEALRAFLGGQENE